MDTGLTPIIVPDYELIAKCGRGAYGDVYVARSLAGSLVALKIIEKNSHSEKEFKGLHNYCSRCGNSPYLIKIFHTGESQSFFYYTMELADNSGDENNYIPSTLAHYLADHKRLPVREVRTLALNLLAGLDTLHGAGLVHRDIKPENIIFVNKVPKLSDIGLVTSFSVAFSLGGTLGFIPPEKLKSSSSTKSATDDLYALGKLIYCAFTGNPPDKFPSIPQDIILDKETKELNDVVLVACNKVSHLRFHTISQFRAALTTSISRKRKTLNFIWKHRYSWAVCIVLYLSAITALQILVDKLENPEDNNRYKKTVQTVSPDVVAIRANHIPFEIADNIESGNKQSFPSSNFLPAKVSQPGHPSFAADNQNVKAIKSVPFEPGGTIVPSVITEFEFESLLKQPLDSAFIYLYVTRVDYYLLIKGSRKLPRLQEAVTAYLTRLAMFEALLFKHMPNKVAEIKTVAKNCDDATSVLSALLPMVVANIRNNEKIYQAFCDCALHAENVKVVFMEERDLLPEAIAWDKYLRAVRLNALSAAAPVYFQDPFGGKDTDLKNVLIAYQNLLQNSSGDNKEHSRLRVERFLKGLKSRISTPAIAALEVELPPLKIRLATARAIRTFAQKNIDDYLAYKYGVDIWTLRGCYESNYPMFRNKIQAALYDLPAIQQHRAWLKNQVKKLNEMREHELKNTADPQVIAYLQAKNVLTPY